MALVMAEAISKAPMVRNTGGQSGFRGVAGRQSQVDDQDGERQQRDKQASEDGEGEDERDRFPEENQGGGADGEQREGAAFDTRRGGLRCSAGVGETVGDDTRGGFAHAQHRGAHGGPEARGENEAGRGTEFPGEAGGHFGDHARIFGADAGVVKGVRGHEHHGHAENRREEVGEGEVGA